MPRQTLTLPAVLITRAPLKSVSPFRGRLSVLEVAGTPHSLASTGQAAMEPSPVRLLSRNATCPLGFDDVNFAT